MAVPYSSTPSPLKGLCARFIPPWFYALYAPQCTLFSIQNSILLTILCIFITDADNYENANDQIGKLIVWECFAFQNGYYKLAGQCENTISSAFKLFQSNNLLLI